MYQVSMSGKFCDVNESFAYGFGGYLANQEYQYTGNNAYALDFLESLKGTFSMRGK